ncbi:MAG: serine/threonine-protein kinase [Gemmatales bacterium]|nr:serine/threonine protein kinase [Gemmatales bacterium]MDW7995421.1 serine/threonine-protein kinase [Gemmatales bacterium]
MADAPQTDRSAVFNSEPDDPELLQEAALLEGYWDGDSQTRARLRREHPELASLFDCLDALGQSPGMAKRPAEPGAKQSEPAPGASGLTLLYAERPGESAAKPPRQFGRYELLDEIGRGGMGVVYRAVHVELKRVVAVKMILSGYLADAEQIRRFQQEARTAARIRHPNIVSVFDYGEAEGHHYFAMDYIAGTSLQQLIQQGPLPPEPAVRLVATIARAVAHLHEHGIIHRDLKPSNVLLDEHGQPHVSDFGLAKWLQESEPRTLSGAVLGTPSYMAPEQAQGLVSAITPRTDIYSLGAILYALLTGRPPFVGENPIDIILQVLESEPPSPRQLRPEIPRDVELICLKCLEKDPARRYASAQELAEDLERVLRGESPNIAPYSLVERVSRWFRREPALALHLLGLTAVAGIVQVTRIVNSEVQRSVSSWVLGVMLIWLGLVLFLRWLARFPAWARYLPGSWCLLDVMLLTLILWLANDQLTPLVVAYPAFVVGSGLWGQRPLIWLTTWASVLAYSALITEYALRAGGWHALSRPHHHLLFLVLVVLTGGATAWQVARLQMLNRYCQGHSASRVASTKA